MKSLAAKIGLAVAIVFVAVVFLLIFLEMSSRNKYVISNKTDMNITNIKLVFQDEEEGLPLLTICENVSVNKGEKQKGKFETINFGAAYGELLVEVTFEGKDVVEYADGLFYGTFDGKLDLEFYETDGQLRLRTTAGEGLFNKTTKTALDNEEIYIDWTIEDYWDWVDSDEEDDLFDDEDFEEEDDDDMIVITQAPTETNESGSGETPAPTTENNNSASGDTTGTEDAQK